QGMKMVFLTHRKDAPLATHHFESRERTPAKEAISARTVTQWCRRVDGGWMAWRKACQADGVDHAGWLTSDEWGPAMLRLPAARGSFDQRRRVIHTGEPTMSSPTIEYRRKPAERNDAWNAACRTDGVASDAWLTLSEFGEALQYAFMTVGGRIAQGHLFDSRERVPTKTVTQYQHQPGAPGWYSWADVCELDGEDPYARRTLTEFTPGMVACAFYEGKLDHPERWNVREVEVKAPPMPEVDTDRVVDAVCKASGMPKAYLDSSKTKTTVALIPGGWTEGDVCAYLADRLGGEWSVPPTAFAYFIAVGFQVVMYDDLFWGMYPHPPQPTLQGLVEVALRRKAQLERPALTRDGSCVDHIGTGNLHDMGRFR
ncbi:MAG TPA: hypothetical protein VMX57_01825, partial [Planctomycetota bacterium]|nr:hypothetical protein [Planctomycetota bacterium]